MKWLLVLSIIFCVACGCKQNRNRAVIPELLVYCENNMVTPVAEISSKFEAMYKCKVRIHNDCARNIISAINYTHKGDIFIPASRQAISWLKSAEPSTVSDSLYIGDNRLVFIVKKGNPLLFAGDINALSNPEHAVVLVNPEASSLGLETMKLLQANGAYDSIIANTIALTVDSRNLIRNIANNEASITIDWLSNYEQSKKSEIDTVNIATEYEYPEVYAFLLGTTSYSGLAWSFMAELSTQQSSDIFAKYGIRKQQKNIFN
ncbi:MAG: substrate-binding domain-containing protein [Cytophagaceae bacterium]|jgi:ABC-type molybdate transport system substrate-binding protein|nr:substrate-binding domain-containing protein [Cytophagaceae bacterium]